jgi:hypothetical protein
LPQDAAANGPFFTTFVIQCPIRAALSWYPTDTEYRKIVASVDGEVPNMAGILKDDAVAQEIMQKNRERVQGLAKMLGD